MRRRGRPPYPDILTPREFEVLSLLREGLTDPQIGEHVGISRRGASWHVSEIIGKLGVTSRYEAAEWQPTTVPWRKVAVPAFLAWPFKNLWWGASAKAAAAAAVTVTVVAISVPEGFGLIVTDPDIGPVPDFPGFSYVTAGGTVRLADSPASDTAGVWSPDCSRIAFASDREGSVGFLGDIYAMDPDGTALINLSRSLRADSQPAWSPDGTRIAFTSLFEGNSDIYLMSADGADQTNLTNLAGVNRDPDWSADGKQILFTRFRERNPDVHLINADGTGQSNLTQHPATDGWAIWSPDGDKIAFASNRHGDGEADPLWLPTLGTSIYVMGPDGSGVKRLTQGSSTDVAPRWSPDSKWISFTRVELEGPRVYVMKSDGTDIAFLVEGQGAIGRPASIGANRTGMLSSVRGRRAMRTFEPTSALGSAGLGLLLLGSVLAASCGGSQTASGPEEGTASAAAAVAAGGSGKIAYVSDRDGNFEIYAMNSDGSGQTRLTNNPAEDVEPDWSPDGSKIAFFSNRDGNHEIYVMDADGSNQTRLTDNIDLDEGPAWSPDGTRIAYHSRIGEGNWEIYVMNADGSNQTRLTFNLTRDTAPAWSPDGARIAYVSGHKQISVMNSDGSSQVRITDGLGDGAPAWSSDGGKIAFHSERADGDNMDVYVMDPDGTNPTRLTNSPGGAGAPAWSPDGTKIAFFSLTQEGVGISAMDADGANITRLTVSVDTDLFSGPSWAPGSVSGSLLGGSTPSSAVPAVAPVAAGGSLQLVGTALTEKAESPLAGVYVHGNYAYVGSQRVTSRQVV